MKKTSFVLLAAFALSVALGGFFWFRQEKEVRSLATKSFESVTGEEGWVWFPVPELGIKIKVKADIAPELVYQTKNFDSTVAIQLTTNGLVQMSQKNGLGFQNSEGYYTCDLGRFIKYNESLQEYLSKKDDDYRILGESADFGKFFVVFYASQSACSDNNKADMNYENYLSQNWLKRDSNGIRENIQQSIKQLQ